MYRTVFISHSRYDPNLDFFHKVFSAVPITAIWMEFEDITAPPYLSIRDNVNKSDALFVLLSEHLVDKQHTNNWVSFEVGLAANRTKVFEKDSKNLNIQGLDVYVFEPIDQHIAFTVPYFTHFMRYRNNDQAFIWLRNMLRGNKLSTSGFSIHCPWASCKIEFNYLSRFYTDSYYCPACGGEVIFKKSYKDIDLDKLSKDITAEVIKRLNKPE